MGPFAAHLCLGVLHDRGAEEWRGCMFALCPDRNRQGNVNSVQHGKLYLYKLAQCIVDCFTGWLGTYILSGVSLEKQRGMCRTGLVLSENE